MKNSISSIHKNTTQEVITWVCYIAHCGGADVAYLFTQVLLPILMPTLAEAVDPITLRVCTAVGLRHPYSAVAVAIVLEYTTADQEMKLE